MLRLLLLSIFFTLVYSCGGSDDGPNPPEPTPQPEPEPQPTSPVNYNLAAMPYESLADYNFFEGEMRNLTPVYGVLPYDLVNSLFTDYAKKKRFIWMPADVSGQFVADEETFSFPEGTILIKNFYYENVQPANNTRIIETRLMIRKNAEWIFANYIWNESQSEAVLDLVGGTTPVEWIENGVQKTVDYQIPGEFQCLTCHKVEEVASLIGPKPQNINKPYAYTDGSMNQIAKWVEMGYLNENSVPQNIITVSNWENVSLPLQERVRGYVDINCAHCHKEMAHCSYTPMNYEWLNSDDEANLGICVEKEENDSELESFTYIVKPEEFNRSVMWKRMNTNIENIRMPLLGRTIIHEEAVELIENWISGLPPSDCN